MTEYSKIDSACKFKDLHSFENATETTLHEIAKALKGEINGEWVNFRGPEHSSKDRSLGIKFDRNDPDGFFLNSLAGDDPEVCRQYIRSALAKQGIWPPIRQRKDAVQRRNGSNAKRDEFALRIWTESVNATGTLVEMYLSSRGLTCAVPPAIRFHPNLKHMTGAHFPAMVALVTRG